MAYREKPTTRRTRIVLSVIMWVIIGIPMMIAFWSWFGGWSLLLFAGGIWLTKDYIKEGDMFGAVDAAGRAQSAVFKRPRDSDGL